MEFSVMDVREAYLTNDLNNALLRKFMKFEKQCWYDHWSSEYTNGTKRCLDHIKNILNGKIKEIIFFKHFRYNWRLKYREGNIAFFTTNRKHIGESDFVNDDKVSIELKAYDLYKTNEEIMKDLKSSKYKFIYHSAERIVFWFPYECAIKLCYKEKGLWHIIEADKNLLSFEFLEDMKKEYQLLKVSTFKLKE